MLRRGVGSEVLRREAARELDQSCRSRRVVAGRSRFTSVVAMSNDEDGLLRPPGNDGDHIAQLDRPRSARSSDQTSSSELSPSAAIVSEYQRVACDAPSEPGTRDGYSADSDRASVAAFGPSNSGSSDERGSVPVVDMENRNASTAGTTTTKPTRTRRALRGRSTVPRRSRRPRVRGRTASIAGL